MRIDLDLRRLRMFVEVVRQGSFSQAAKAVFATQPTVSKAVKQLEGELGVTLLERDGRSSKPTAAGAMVYHRGLELLSAAGDLTTELDDLQGLKRGTLRVGFPRLSSTALFAPLFTTFRRQYPGIDVSLVVQNSRQLADALRAGELDLAALGHPVPEEFDRQEMRVEPLMALLPRTHPFAGRRAIKADKLGDAPVILFEEGAALNDLILEAFADHGILPRIAARSSQVDFIFEIVAAGTGIGFLPRTAAKQRVHRSVRLSLFDEPKCKWAISFAWRRGAHLSHAARAWLEHFRARHKKESPGDKK